MSKQLIFNLFYFNCFLRLCNKTTVSLKRFMNYIFQKQMICKNTYIIYIQYFISSVQQSRYTYIIHRINIKTQMKMCTVLLCLN